MRRLLLLTLLGACGAKDPVYIRPMPVAIEVDPGNMVGALTSSVQLPVRLETGDQRLEREALAMRLGLDPAQVPQARRDDYDVSIEWTIKNLSDQDGTATISVIGASEFYFYDPMLFVIDEEEDAPPPLMGGIPVQIAGNATVSGVFREDQLAEAAQDWDAISRGGITPEFAYLDQWDTGTVVGGMGGELAEIPAEAVAALVRVDLTFAADTHMVLEYVLRVRDKSDRLDPFETDLGLLVPPSMTAYMPPPPPMP